MSNRENIRIEKIQRSDFDKVARLLTDAFETNPAYSLIFSKSGKIREGLFWLFKTNLFLINRRELFTKVIKEKNSAKIVGVFTVIPPEGVNIHPVDYFQIGLPQFILKFGFKTLHTMLGMDSYNKEVLTKALLTEKYYYLSMVAIKEEYRGKGIGSYAIKNCLDEFSQRERSSDLLALTTQLPENVEFYSKLGFIQIDESTIHFKGNNYRNWNMKFNFPPGVKHV